MGKIFFLDTQFLSLKGTIVLICWSSMSKRGLPQGKVCLQFRVSATQSVKTCIVFPGLVSHHLLDIWMHIFPKRMTVRQYYILICMHSILLSITLIQTVWFHSNTIGLHYVVRQHLRLNHRIFAIFRTFSCERLQ